MFLEYQIAMSWSYFFYICDHENIFQNKTFSQNLTTSSRPEWKTSYCLKIVSSNVHTNIEKVIYLGIYSHMCM